ncbi:thiol-disulfide isomerase/thioredoxin [Sphingomonas vulcanisoli]|uniref:Thiol-disulfide isomerase/thioredoxin n=1 Tax=Sphingomonas vulcanisoli TaxID=1658060 RepID=A0ABX0TW33_9SPHN|nr:TlpA disulfide reductase family protein [Sphingomonas vulcanisoli]NIJ09651.1 thiol-disulfide isomerase/thioredoxin [Sphingomonas vulcanisoli]
MRRLYPAFALLLAGFGAACHKQTPPAPQPAAATAAQPILQPSGFQVSVDNKGKSAPDTEISDILTGQKIKLASFKGKPLLVNLWATWCAPCVRELPTLDKLAKAQGDRLRIVAISEDLEGAKVIQPFLLSKGIELHPYHDTDNGLMLAYKEGALPVSILYDADGKELWRASSDIDWTGPKAKELLSHAGI